MDISLTGIKARDKVIKGANYVADTVKSTLGPFGMNALLEKGNRITNDGFTVSKALCVAIEDEFERRGAVTMHEVASKTNDQVGDATSSSEVLAQAILKEAIRFLPTESSVIAKKTSAELIKQIDTEKDEIITLLEEYVTPINTEKELIDSARVSVEDDTLAELIGKAQFKIGKDGVIIAEEHNQSESEIEYISGIKFDSGFASSALINNPEKQTVEAEDCHVLLTNYIFNDLSPIAPIIDQLVKTGVRKIAIIGRGFSSDFVKVCIENTKNGVYFYPINAPYTDQAEVSRDIASLIGGSYIDTEETSLSDITLDDVGYASRIVSKRYETVITGNESPDARLTVLEAKLKGAVSDFERKSIQTRISQLTHGFAILKVGAKTEVDRKRLKDKADDAVNAIRLAYQGGTVPGAGQAFNDISKDLPNDYILKRPLQAIYNQIMSSAPKDFVIEPWVRDPFLVLKCALENACSVASVLSTVSAVVAAENPKKRKYENNNDEE